MEEGEEVMVACSIYYYMARTIASSNSGSSEIILSLGIVTCFYHNAESSPFYILHAVLKNDIFRDPLM